ncbi:MAG: hypothetical protein J0H71_21185 [Rhizobiales bacterium]|nr:hypothetical protein [Hyphomicrobiales bacterium]
MMSEKPEAIKPEALKLEALRGSNDPIGGRQGYFIIADDAACEDGDCSGKIKRRLQVMFGCGSMFLTHFPVKQGVIVG